ncbi:MAG TPA: ABC transporter permease [Blastocatellia bacterium]|nr:ABC transporter permease [Blastocatellia bacterium]
MGTLVQDLRYGVRVMLKQPGFTAVAVIALALGIGANTAIFSAVNAVLLRPLPFPEPERLVLVRDLQQADETPASYPEYLDWKEQSRTFDDLAVAFNTSSSLTGQGEPEQLLGVRVSANLLPMLGVKTEIGRNFQPEEESRSGERVVILSYSLWQRRFGGDPEVLGRNVTLSGRGFTVIGVLPAGIKGLLPRVDQLEQSRDLWMPLRLDASNAPRGLHFLTVIGRLRGGLSLQMARDEVSDVADQLRQTGATQHGIMIVPLIQFVVGSTRPALLILLGAVGLVLMIACANVANLMLARAQSRRKEIAVRLALGASRARLIRQLLTESVLLSSVSGTLGVVLALWGVDSLAAASRAWLPRAEGIKIDATVLLFTLGVSLLTAILFGLAPALRASSGQLSEALKEGGQRAGHGRDRLRSLLVVSEVALSLVLLVGAGLLIKSFVRLLSVDKGFDPRQVLALDLSLPESKYAEPPQQAQFFQQVLERVAALPGVEGAASVSNIPLGDGGTNGGVQIEGKNFPPESEPIAEKLIVSAGYFRIMRIPLRSGRYFDERDAAGNQQVAIINESFARTYFQGEDPIGKRIDFGWDTTGWQEVVGMIGDVKHYGLDEAALPAVYVPQLQRPSSSMTVVVRTTPDPRSLSAAVRSQVFEVDRDQPISRVRIMEQVVSASVASRRLSMALLAGFAVVALALAAVGLYGVMSYVVTQRTHEIGVRMALGARVGDVLGLVLKQGMVLVLIGVGTGLVAALAVTRLIASLLYGVSPTDLATFVVIALLLTAVALLACYLPARRATKVDPMVALRYE